MLNIYFDLVKLGRYVVRNLDRGGKFNLALGRKIV